MKTAISCAVALSTAFTMSFAQPITQWTMTYGGSNDDIGYSVQQTNDGGYIISGYTDSFGAGHSDVYLIKTDTLGNQQWSQLFGGSTDDKSESIQQTDDGGYIIAGICGSFYTGIYDIYLIKTDTSGNQQWSRTFGGGSDDRAYDVQQTSDRGYIIAGYTNSYGAGHSDVYLIKTDTLGYMQWYRTFGGNNWDAGASVQQTNDGGYIIAGYFNYSYTDDPDVYLVKTDTLGYLEWRLTYGGDEDDNGWSVQQTTDGGYIIAGETASFGAAGKDVYLIKTDSLGNQQWSQTFGGTTNDYGYSVQQTTHDGYIIAGMRGSSGASSSDVYLIKTDSLGNEQWSQLYGGSFWDSGWSVQQVSDEGFIIVGETASYGSGGSDVYLIKTAPDVTPVESMQSGFVPEFPVIHPAYPNPFNPTTTINYGIPRNNFVSLTIYNMLGQRVATLVNGMQLAGDHEAMWNAAGHPSGFYFARLQTGNYTKTIKMVLLK